MAQTENQKKLLKRLNEIFQLDQSDLDFGIYRIMNTKSKEINEFLDKDLLSSVASAFSSNDNNSIQKELDEAIQQAQSLGADPETLPKVKALRVQLSTTSSSSNLENEVFSHLANFFNRYYKDEDFVSLRRYKKDTYAIPYEGEEVKLHWANSDQYYIKSGEYFRDYTFTVNDKTIHLKLSDAETESNNNKATSDKERRFVIQDVNPCEVIDDELYINFEYKAIGKENQDKLNEKAITKALESIEDEDFTTALNTLAQTEKNKKRTIFEKHLKSYTSRNSFDYFIHKDLGGFLGRELDFYIKNEMLFLDDIMDSPIKYEEVMGKVKIFKEVSQKIIAFLTQLEELQKKLWEKKKFVIETNYCITLDKIDEDYYEEIFACDEQKAEWKELFDIDIQSVDDLKEEKYLVLDTKFFDMKFKYKLLSEFDNLDEDIDGVLINSENFGALNLLQDRYREQIKTVYIDPPYNTGSDGFLYNDRYKHSSWMSFIFDRLSYAKNLMSSNGIIFSSIDDNEFFRFKQISDLVFDETNYIQTVEVKSNEGAAQEFQNPFMPKNCEYGLLYAKNYSSRKYIPIWTERDYDKAYNKIVLNIDEEDYHNWNVDTVNNVMKATLGENPTPKKATKFYIDNAYRIFQTIAPKGAGGGLKEAMEKSKITTWDSYIREVKDDILCYKGRMVRFYIKNIMNIEGKDLIVKEQGSLWTDIAWTGIAKEGNVKLKAGKKPEKFLNRVINLSSEKSENSIVLDFFTGSGTTPSVAHKLGKKYIGIEMGEYFDTLTLKRMKYTLYGNSNGIQSITNGGVFKYFKLESYEDSLNNLEFKKTEEQQKTLDFHPEAKEDYILNYSLDVESKGSLLNIDTFSTPFDYKLKIATSSVGETKDTNIDLVETFNYLLGLVVKRIELLKGYLVVEGQNLKKEKILIIWRDGQSSDELNEFFKKMDWSVYDREFDTIYVNGDNNLDNLRKDEDHFKVKLIEQEFKKLMFGE